MGGGLSTPVLDDLYRAVEESFGARISLGTMDRALAGSVATRGSPRSLPAYELPPEDHLVSAAVGTA
jgi:hypothetical protein